MPTANSGITIPDQIDINYSGNLYLDDGSIHSNSLSADPLIGDGGLVSGNTGGFGITPTDYSWLWFGNNLSDLVGSNTPVTLTWGGASLLNTSGTGSFDLYWSNLADGPGNGNELLASVSVVNGKIMSSTVPEPTTIALVGLGLAGFAAARRRATNTH